ncbi:Zinc finger CCHC domain-containing protein 7 [Merluccius polli]|uniref:Zinc finger CCHC domain-containing protein 7 n=1 Tax=Merluccius polli TaxID=89951 RepID=A0AA47N0E7_MERPO|nr:Zinc finger CCHC domain-containing protein 7 [Merluccius polli]
MDCTKPHGVEDEGGGKGQEVPFYCEGCSNSESELEISFHHQAYSSKNTPRITRGQSPPLVLAFPLSTVWDSSPDGDQELSSDDEPIEEWMILGGEAQAGDGDLQLNLGYWSGSGSDGGSESDDDPSWAVTEKDKCGTDRPSQRYFCAPQRSLTCRNCNKTGHLARVCPSHKRRATCSLCGLRGHRQRGCPRRHCPGCGLPPHGNAPCPQRPLWDQHCLRCGMTGHLAEACPDTWRQYHLTVRAEAPLKPETGHTPKDTNCSIHCYNCSQSGHYGYECAKKRMTSGTFPSLPYVCHYDTGEEVSELSARMQRRAQELGDMCSLPLSERPHYGKLPKVGDKHSRPAQCGAGNRRREQPGPHSREGKRVKAERRREKQELKKLRRQAQARRQGGLLGRCRAGARGGSDEEEAYLADPFRNPRDPRQGPPPPKRRRADEEEGCGAKAVGETRSRKCREAERWKKRRGMRRGFLYPHGDLGATDQNLLSPKNRTRHRRR